MHVLVHAEIRSIQDHLLEELRRDVGPDDDHDSSDRQVRAVARERHDDDRSGAEDE